MHDDVYQMYLENGVYKKALVIGAPDTFASTGNNNLSS